MASSDEAVRLSLWQTLWSIKFKIFFGDRDDRNDLGDRLNFQVGILARTTSHRRTCRQEAKRQRPPSQRSALSISACGEAANRNKLIKAVARSCNSAGRILVVNRKSRVGINAWCKGKTRVNCSELRARKERGAGVELSMDQCSETNMGIKVMNQ